MTVGEATGIIGLIRSWLLDRPSVKLLLIAARHAATGSVRGIEGDYGYIEVHCTGRVPVRITWVGLELDDGQVFEFEYGDPLPATLTRPEMVTRELELGTLREAVRRAGPDRRLKRLRVKASPDHVFRAKLPKGWDKFPDGDPPLEDRGSKGPFFFFGR